MGHNNLIDSRSAGYSGKSLASKLGIQPGSRMLLVNPPAGYLDYLGDLPAGAAVALQANVPQFDFIQAFVTHRQELETSFFNWKNLLKSDGMLWISWPKGSSKLPKDINENNVREIGLANGLVDVKIAAIDPDWSGLKFVYRLIDRDQAGQD